MLGAGARGLAGVASARLVKAADHGAEDPPLSLNSSGWLGAAAAEGQQRVRLSRARPRRFLRLAARARSPRPPDGPTLPFRYHRRRTQPPAAC